MDLKLQEKVAVVTGGGSGIGKACALALAAEGCRVAICGRSVDKLDSMKNEFSTRGYPLLAMVADVSLEADTERLARETCQQFGRIDIWINNAGISYMKPLLAMSGDEWDQMMRVNLKSVFLATKAAVPYMKANGGGVILNASSFATVIPQAGRGAYAAAKSAVSSLTRSLAAELAPFNIRVNAYVPGLIVTEMTASRVPTMGLQWASQIALNRLGTPEEMADAIVFLASDAARYITGAELEVSGGKFAVQIPTVPWEWEKAAISAK
jgi:NAD(P)-dependent dehydrogenase (short-subunit alcohol dehydrogenase family)